MIDLWERRGYRTASWVMLVPFGWALGWVGSKSISWMAALAFPYLLVDIAIHARGLVVVAMLGAKKARVLGPMLTVLVPPVVFVVLVLVGPQEHSGGCFDTPAPVALLVAHFLASIPFAIGIDMASRQAPRSI